MPTNTRALRLHRDRLTDLQSDDLGRIVGGVTNETGTLCITENTCQALLCLNSGMVACLTLGRDC